MVTVLPKKSVVASCLPQLSPVNSNRASLVNICTPCQPTPACRFPIAPHTTLHLRGEIGLWLKTRAGPHRQRSFPRLKCSPCCARAFRGWRPLYLPETQRSCQSAPPLRHPHAFCPCFLTSGASGSSRSTAYYASLGPAFKRVLSPDSGNVVDMEPRVEVRSMRVAGEDWAGSCVSIVQVRAE